MKFEKVLGHKSLKKQLINGVLEQKTAHALLFSGKEGNGALALALAYAQFLNCENRTENDSCGVCNACNKNQKLIHPDVLFTFPVYSLQSGKPGLSTDFLVKWRTFVLEDSNFSLPQWMAFIANENKAGNITAAECNEIIRKVSLKNFEAKYKVVIIYIAELLGKEANKILKILEEPPANTIFILITFQQEKILNTITSRTQIINVATYSDEEIENYILKNNENIEANLAKQIALLANGSLVEVRNILNESFNNYSEILLKWFRSVFKNNASMADGIVTEINNLKREGQKHFINYTLKVLRDVLICAYSHKKPNRLNESENKLIIYLAQKLNLNQIEKISKIFDHIFYFIERNGNPKIQFFYLFTKHLKIVLNN